VEDKATEITLAGVGQYELPYDHLDGPAKVCKGVRDVVNYLGWETFTSLTLATHATEAGWTAFQEAVASKGIRGYPVAAWWQMITGIEVSAAEMADISAFQARAVIRAAIECAACKAVGTVVPSCGRCGGSGKEPTSQGGGLHRRTSGD
jgi:hypothetical protein